jgi:hypothetical protein
MRQNNELKFRLQAMEQQAQLRDGASPLISFSPCTCTCSLTSDVLSTSVVATSDSLELRL